MKKPNQPTLHSVKKTTLGRGNCQSYNDIPDTVSPHRGGTAGVTWWHRNDYSISLPAGTPSYYEWATNQAGINQSSSGRASIRKAAAKATTAEQPRQKQLPVFTRTFPYPA